MKEKGLAIITGADGGMGQVITTALAKEGFPIIMACQNPEKAIPICNHIRITSKNSRIEIRKIDLASLSSVSAFAEQLLKDGQPVSLLINNAGILTTKVRRTEDGLETIVSVNYVAPYLLTRKILPLMEPGARIVNTVSCTYAIGKIEPEFFEKGKSGHFSRIPVYGNTKLALLLFTQELAVQIKDRGIIVNATDPGIVSTNMITMHAWFDPLTDILFRPFIKTPSQGAATAIYLALSDQVKEKNGCCFANCKEKNVSKRIRHHVAQKELWDSTEEILRQKGFRI
ncbi:SDR family oxidoreductase [Parabacteroides sp. AM08-6]|uniref:SDR family oxidoreductase n=1 Tax=Parabacteroides sp. AM08-6 TaxID=2292053 RepID=UPI000EFE4D05|nr:SDR family oxidoreductase [Parabacteroides sp. AM08-6]RHJ85423.1 SDR family NAD(P)-dependent oxidoreductase [Parabacteroides sp. AM08-6]